MALKVMLKCYCVLLSTRVGCALQRKYAYYINVIQVKL